jgi:hypothetical protein
MTITRGMSVCDTTRGLSHVASNNRTWQTWPIQSNVAIWVGVAKADNWVVGSLGTTRLFEGRRSFDRKRFGMATSTHSNMLRNQRY